MAPDSCGTCPQGLVPGFSQEVHSGSLSSWDPCEESASVAATPVASLSHMFPCTEHCLVAAEGGNWSGS